MSKGGKKAKGSVSDCVENQAFASCLLLVAHLPFIANLSSSSIARTRFGRFVYCAVNNLHLLESEELCLYLTLSHFNVGRHHAPEKQNHIVRRETRPHHAATLEHDAEEVWKVI